MLPVIDGGPTDASWLKIFIGIADGISHFDRKHGSILTIQACTQAAHGCGRGVGMRRMMVMCSTGKHHFLMCELASFRDEIRGHHASINDDDCQLRLAVVKYYSPRVESIGDRG